MAKAPFIPDKNRIDSLTGLYQREVIFSYMEYLIANKSPFCYAILDVDNFKNINDTFGHRAGDQVLSGIASQLLSLIKGHGLLGRYGGDEFIFVLDGDYDYDSQWNFCFKILRSPTPIDIGQGEKVPFTYTIGMARYPFDAATLDDLFDLADKALYRGKTKGRDCFIIYLESKHKNIFLKSVRERNYTSMYLHNHIHALLTKEDGDLEENLTEALSFAGSCIMADLLFLQTAEGIKNTYCTPLGPELSPAYVDPSLILTEIRHPTTYFAENTLTTSPHTHTPLYEELKRHGAFATVIVELSAFGNFYGFLRCEMLIRGNNRIWQQPELAFLISLAQEISLVYYANKKTPIPKN